MPSKMVLDHDNGARSASEAADTYAEQIAEALALRLRPLLRSDEALPDLALCVRLFGRLVVADAQALVAADDANEAELADDPPVRAARDTAVDQLYPILVDLRDALAPGYGPAGLAAMQLSEPATKEPKALARLAGAVASALRGPATLTPRRAGVMVDRAQFEAEIAPLAASLSAAVTSLEREGKENQQTLDAKNKAFAQAERSLGKTSAILVALLELAGLEKLAESVLPTLRRRSAVLASPAAPVDSTT
jgi:hypothetical protein